MQDSTHMINACPLCGSSHLLGSFHREEIRELYDLESQVLNLSLCRHCGFVFQNPILAVLQDAAHYANHSSYTLRPTDQITNAKQDQFRWIRGVARRSGFLSALTLGGRTPGIFEVGTSVGTLLAIAKLDGWQVGGVEPSLAAVTAAFEDHGIIVLPGDLRQLCTIDLPVIAMVHVLEHIPDPATALRHLYQVSSDLSMLSVEVPDFSFPRNAGGTGFFVPEHVSYFTPETLVDCAQSAGWRTIDLYIHEYENAQDYCLYPVLRGSFIKRSSNHLEAHRNWARELALNELGGQNECLAASLKAFIAMHSPEVVFLVQAGTHECC